MTWTVICARWLIFGALFGVAGCSGDLTILHSPERKDYPQNAAEELKQESGSDSGTYVGNGHTVEPGTKSLQLACGWSLTEDQRYFKGDCSLNIDTKTTQKIRWAFSQPIQDAFIITDGANSSRATVMLPESPGAFNSAAVSIEIYVDEILTRVEGTALDINAVREQVSSTANGLISDGQQSMLLIENGAAYTSENPVTLSVGDSDAVSVYFTNNPLCDRGGVWENLTQEKLWTLPGENQEVTVYMRLKFADGTESECYRDSVIHDNLAPVRPIAFNDGDHTLLLTQTPVMTWSLAPYDEDIDFEISLGRGPGLDDLMPWMEVGNSETAQLQNLSLTSGQVVFSQVRSVDRAGNRSSATIGDGFLVGPVGVPDSSYQSNGFALVANSQRHYGSTNIQSDGKILLSGTSDEGEGNYSARVWRHLESGISDPAFSSLPLPSPEAPNQTCKFPVDIMDVYQLPEGGILAVGSYSDCKRYYGLIWKLTPQGLPDSNFGQNGMVSMKSLGFTSGSSEFLKVRPQQKDGKILAGGYLTGETADSPVILRLLPDGKPDPQYASGGLYTQKMQFSTYFEEMWLDSEGRVLVSYSVFETQSLDVRVLRLTTEGRSDSDFGALGVWSHTGKAGTWTLPGQFIPDRSGGFIVTAEDCSASPCDWEMLRVSQDGSLNADFGVNGVLRGSAHFPQWPGMRANSLMLDTDGKIMISSRNCAGDQTYMTVLRVDGKSGLPDTTFGNDGFLTLSQQSVSCVLNAGDRLFRSSDGKLLLAATVDSSRFGLWMVR